jgi:hypothetical protein
MRIQKLLTSTNKLPQYDAYPEFVANMKVHAENEDKNVLKATMDNISGLLGDLSTLNNVSFIAIVLRILMLSNLYIGFIYCHLSCFSDRVLTFRM